MRSIVYWVFGLMLSYSELANDPSPTDPGRFIINHHSLSQDPFCLFAWYPQWSWLSNSHKLQLLSDWTIILLHYSLKTEHLCVAIYTGMPVRIM